ncbi:MAG: GTPase HflX [Spirochaetaceae bacterium]|jgi:GTP-binding protein HflX|nr:GTPase HflX [Spirochaetaceae bacterium]
MRDLHPTVEAPRRALLVGIRDGKLSPAEADSLARELASLAGTLGLEIAGEEIVHNRAQHGKFGVGTGKAEELSAKAAELGVDCLVFDRELSPSQQWNWEKLSGISAVDRQELIIQIFASRARTREAALQAELAELAWSLPRLNHRYIDLSRQRGGHYGTRGAGETRFETDRRKVLERIRRRESELARVRQNRDTQRKKRAKAGLPVCALVGYTNAGKSSLLNALSGSAELAEDKLFATLDSATRRVPRPGGTALLLVDTVGFIRRLPHTLVAAFRSTLEEAALADMVIQVLDASDPGVENCYNTTIEVLRDLGAEKTPAVIALNKVDRLSGAAGEERLAALMERYRGSIPVSAHTGAGLDALLARLDAASGSGAPL